MKTGDEQFLDRLRNEITRTLTLFNEKNISPDSFCVMPFANITLEPTGEVGICRHKGTEFTFGNLREKTIDEIWQSEAMQSWRREMVEGKPQTCARELVEQRCNLCPELNKLLPHADIANVVSPKILRLTANFNGKCNLQCPMCDVWQLPNGFYNEENFWIPGRRRFFKDIREIDMLSGEPFIQKETFRLIDEVTAVNPDCLWSITTNMHWKLSDSIKASLDKIRMKNLIVSIDSLVPESYAKIRHPGKLDFVMSNLERMLEYQTSRVERNLSPLNIRLNCVTQKENWRELKTIIRFCLEREIVPFMTFLYEPSQFSLLTLSAEERMNILDFYLEEMNRDELQLIQRVAKPLIRSLPKIDYTYYMQEMQTRLQ